MDSADVRCRWECFVKSEEMPEESKHPFHLTPWDLQMLQLQYAQRGVFFLKPPEFHNQENAMEALLEKLKTSFSKTLSHYYPFSGRLKIQKQENSNTFSVSVDCNDSPGGKFVYATSDLSVSDFISRKNYDSLFDDHTGVFNCEGVSRSLMTIQVTEFVDGMCMGLSANHCVADGATYSGLLTLWSEIFNGQPISGKPVFDRFFPDGYGPIVNLPTTFLDEIMSERKPQSLKTKIFHLSAESIAKLKQNADSEENRGKKQISAFQVMTALLWRCITRSRNLNPDKETTCCFSANNRPRLIPPLSRNYFGNMVSTAKLKFTAGEVLSQSLGWAALKVNEAVDDLTDEMIRGQIGEWLSRPWMYRPDSVPTRVKVGSSPRFTNYENEFGMGRGVAICNGRNNTSDGKISAFPGREGGGSMDLDVCLSPESMDALEADQEFLSFVS